MDIMEHQGRLLTKYKPIRTFIFIALLPLIIACNETRPETAILDFPMEIILEVPTDTLIKGSKGYGITNGIVSKNNTVFNGIELELYHDGSVKKESQIIDGRRHGKSLRFYENGSTYMVRFYQDGKKQGEHKGYYPDGSSKFIYYFNDGLSEGNHQDWSISGNLYKDFNYEKGFERGYQKMWNSDNSLRANYFVNEEGRRFGLLGIKKCVTISNSDK